MVQIVPSLEGVKISHCWTGKTAFTFDMMPHTGSHDGVEYAMGWCGSGVPMGTYLGHKTALRVLGDPRGREPLRRPALPDLAVLHRPPLVSAAGGGLEQAQRPQAV